MLCLGLVFAVGLSACVAVPAGPAYEPGVSVGVSFYQSTYPNMVLVPGYPVYYYPYGNANYFFYDGMYWLYHADRWYSSSWYNGPWTVRGPHYVPYYLLRVPVRYYRAPPPYFHGWRADEPPHWGERWGHDWEERHQGWGKRDRTMPPPAPLPKYQGAYAGSSYPHDRAQQDAIRKQNDRYEPHGNMTRPVSQPSERPSYSQQQPQPRQAPAAPGWQPQAQQVQPHQEPAAPHWQTQPQSQQQEQRPPRDPAPREQGNWQQRPTPGAAPRSQPVPANRQPTPNTPPQTPPYQEQHRESPPVRGQPPRPAPQPPQATPSSQESSELQAPGQAKKSPPPDKSGDHEDNRRSGGTSRLPNSA